MAAATSTILKIQPTATSDALPIGHMGHVPRASRPGGASRPPLPPQKKEVEEEKGKEEEKREKEKEKG